MAHGSKRGFHHKRRDNETEESLLVFGYASRIYSNDARSEMLAADGHLQKWPADDSALIDRAILRSTVVPETNMNCIYCDPNTRPIQMRWRSPSWQDGVIGQRTVSDMPDIIRSRWFDVRLLLTAIPTGSSLPRAKDENEEETEEERWKDLFEAENKAKNISQEEDNKQKKAEIGFVYDDTPTTTTAAAEEDDSSDDEPFVPPPGIKLPLGLETPDSQKLNHVIEKTALFVVQQGAQMEIVIKAKQRGNNEQFGFLHFDHALNPYYKYISKLIREKKYTPAFDKKAPAKKSSQNGDKKKPSALEAIAAEHGSDSDSDSDYELHPSLLAASRRGGSPDPVEKGDVTFAGPRGKPKTPPPTAIRHDYRLETANDAYGALFKSLQELKEKTDERNSPSASSSPAPSNSTSTDPPVDNAEWSDFAGWFESFYGKPPPHIYSTLPYVPPPPDLEKVVSSYARYVATNGPSAENVLLGRQDLQLHFLAASNPHYLYYLTSVRHAQWDLHVQAERATVEAAEAALRAATLPPPPPLNRKQRRNAFSDAPQLPTVASPSVVNPLSISDALDSIPHMVKSASSPVLSLNAKCDSPTPHVTSSESQSPAPVSSGLSGIILQACPAPIPPSSAGHMIPPPLPPVSVPPPGMVDVQSERQLKARLFMEKIMNEKRKKKQEEEEAVEKKDEAAEEGEIEDVSDGEKGRKRRRRSRSKERRKDDNEKPITANLIDKLIKSKMEKILSGGVSTSVTTTALAASAEVSLSETRREEKNGKESKEKEREDKKRKKDKKRRRSHSRSRSRHSSSDEERRRRRRRRSRSRSSDLPSRYRR